MAGKMVESRAENSALRRVQRWVWPTARRLAVSLVATRVLYLAWSMAHHLAAVMAENSAVMRVGRLV